MRTSLEQAGGDEASPAGKRVVTLIEELRLVLTCLMSANPLGMSSLRRVSSFTSAVSSLCKTSLMQCLWPATSSQHGFGTLSFTPKPCLEPGALPSGTAHMSKSKAIWPWYHHADSALRGADLS